MADMRNFINLLETALPSTSTPTHADHGTPLEGAWLDPNELMEFLPGVDNRDYFVRAWRKVMRNQEEELTRLEMFQLAKAFISLVREDDASKMQFMRKLLVVDLADDDTPGNINTTYR